MGYCLLMQSVGADADAGRPPRGQPPGSDGFEW
jgi:hypothetical protein